MTTKLTGLRTGEVSRLLDVAEHRIANLIRFRLIGAPPIVAGRRVWRPADVEAARAALRSRGVITSGSQATPTIDPDDLAQDLTAELEYEAATRAPTPEVRS